jgi:hypothetical protein
VNGADERLRRHAADVETVAAEVPFDERDPGAQPGAQAARHQVSSSSADGTRLCGKRSRFVPGGCTWPSSRRLSSSSGSTSGPGDPRLALGARSSALEGALDGGLVEGARRAMRVMTIVTASVAGNRGR